MKDFMTTEDDNSAQDAIITSMYSTSKDYYMNTDRPTLDRDMPVIVSARSLFPDTERMENLPRTRSLIYFPTTREKCSCSECLRHPVYTPDLYYPTRRVEYYTGSPPHRSTSPDSRLSTSSPDCNSSLEGSLDSLTCVFCTARFSDKVELENHKLIHVNGKSYKCHLCDRSFTWFGNFQKHMLNHGENESKLHPYFSASDVNEEDLLIREGNNIFRCGMCYKTFTRMSGLRTHVRMHSGQRPYKCENCTLAFTTNRALKMHMRIHSGERPYKCTDCEKTFTRKDELQAHIYLHKGEKPYKCNVCSSAFVRHGHLQRHMLTHAEEKPYKCKTCPKSFTQYRNLQTHMYKHTGERPYKCRYCGKGFTQYGTVQAHERTHTGKKPYPCKQCDKRFITSSHLRWHIKRHHAEVKEDQKQ